MTDNEERRGRRDRRLSILPYLLIAIGVIFLLENFGIINDAFSKLWPLLLIVIGIVMLARSFFKE